MDPVAFTKINQAVLLTTLRGFAEHSFSGDVEFRLKGRQILRTVREVHLVDPPKRSSEALQSFDCNWQQIEKWVEGSKNLLQVMFQCGKITKIRSVDRSERWQLIHE
jgi:hypothetical protein